LSQPAACKASTLHALGWNLKRSRADRHRGSTEVAQQFYRMMRERDAIRVDTMAERRPQISPPSLCGPTAT